MADNDVGDIEQRTDPIRGFFLLGIMLGGAVGAALGLLYAPRPGAQVRRDLADRSAELYGRARPGEGVDDAGEGAPPASGTPL
jgi:hypothetical protein